uniref:Apolipoprotein M n=1 Tax=Naja naja TaxID=35670 RepID=A0A8C6VCD3_NAJNA
MDYISQDTLTTFTMMSFPTLIFSSLLLICPEVTKFSSLQYLGRWLFIAAASSSSSSLETFAYVDSTLFSMNQTEIPERLQLRAAIRLKTGQCVPKSWSYLLKEESADLATEGRPHMRTELFSAKCPNTIVVQETDQDYQRILFYSRILHPEEHCIADFWNKASCLDMNELLLIPRTQGR